MIIFGIPYMKKKYLILKAMFWLAALESAYWKRHIPWLKNTQKCSSWVRRWHITLENTQDGIVCLGTSNSTWGKDLHFWVLPLLFSWTHRGSIYVLEQHQNLMSWSWIRSWLCDCEFFLLWLQLTSCRLCCRCPLLVKNNQQPLLLSGNWFFCIGFICRTLSLILAIIKAGQVPSGMEVQLPLFRALETKYGE